MAMTKGNWQPMGHHRKAVDGVSMQHREGFGRQHGTRHEVVASQWRLVTQAARDAPHCRRSKRPYTSVARGTTAVRPNIE
jgi:hypothetical protein